MNKIQKKLNDYDGFVEKFKPKLTTDDCYTPPRVYDFVRAKVLERYALDEATTEIVRPFYPGGDYEAYDYPEGCLVLDNPPFSIISKIVDFYLSRGIRFFLFAPALFSFNQLNREGVTLVGANANIVFENGAVINISFLTNLSPSLAVEIVPWGVELGRLTREVKSRPSYTLPHHVLSGQTVNYLASCGISWSVPRAEVTCIRALDEQRKNGKSIYGSGLLCSDRIAREAEEMRREAEEQRRVVHWSLSPRERAIVESLSQGANLHYVVHDSILRSAES